MLEKFLAKILRCEETLCYSAAQPRNVCCWLGVDSVVRQIGWLDNTNKHVPSETSKPNSINI